MLTVSLAGAAYLALLSYRATVQGAETAAELASNGALLGTLFGVVYYYRDTITKRLDRIEQRLDSFMEEVVRLVAS